MENPSGKFLLLSFLIIVIPLSLFGGVLGLLFADENASLSSQEQSASGKPVPAFSEVNLKPVSLVKLKPADAGIPGTEAADQKKVGYKVGLEDKTANGEVRASNFKMGIDYKVSKNSTVGVEARRGIHDTKDAKAWGKSVEDENSAQANYKLLF